MHQGIEALKPILIKPDPHNLKELRLVNCVTSESIMENLINFIVEERVNLRTLSLVRMQITRRSMDRVATLVAKSENLEDLDLSWNNLLPLDFTVLL